MTNEKYDYFAWIFIAIIIGLMAGYAWAWHHGNIQLERAYDKGYEAAVNDLEAVICEEVCR